MDKGIKRAKIFNYTVSLTFLLIIISVFVLICTWKWRHTFTVSKWIDNPNDRHKIVSSMLSKNKIVGLTENEIINLLGAETEPAPESFKNHRGEFLNESNLIYGLGVDFMSYKWLVITIENGVAVNYIIGIN
ncbi:MAG: hypothetical protein E7407_01140 [Ruminococcaceae bacterium]|nr:hypothetical protein [Oscillospiraceae bacterium]